MRSETNIYDAQVLDEAAVFPNLNTSAWYNFRIARYKSGLIQVYIDNGSGYNATPLLEAIDSTYSTLGHFGWQVDTQTSAEAFYVSWISARKPDVEKPAIKEKPIEDDLITQVSAESGKAYNMAKLITGARQYIDRDYTITSVPQFLNGASFIQVANDDKLNTANSFLTFFVKAPAIVYVAYDSRASILPAWLSDWTKTPYRIETSDQSAGYLNVYSKLTENPGNIYPNPIVLGGNLSGSADGAQTNYFIAAIRRPEATILQAEDALLSGAVVANDHENYNGTGFADFKNPDADFIEWTVNINVPGTYNVGFKFANAGIEERSLQITDNGIDARTVSFSAISSSWSSWAFVSGPEIFLSPGIHKIRLRATGTSGPNVDELSLYYISNKIPLPLLARTAGTEVTADQLQPVYIRAYPNPFVQQTKIYYQLKEKAKVNLSIYNVQGQQVRLLENSIHEAGSYVTGFNAANLAKGIYVYRLQIGNTIKTGKLVKE
jgi:hypothetical protein